MIPYITPPAVVALLFAYAFDGNFGVVNDLLVKVGILDRYVSWLSDPLGSFVVTVAAMVWYGHAADGADPPRVAAVHPAARSTTPRTSTARATGSASATSRCRT